ncbi:MAG: alkanesulfonate monooxygenase [Gammaproteobacteria bacterium]|jgi:alkanesulfonate monooxygenase
MRLGFWPPVYGNWIMTDNPAEGVGSYDYVKECTLLAERSGFDTLLLAEHFIHPNGAKLDLVDAWTSATALAALTEKIEIIAAVKPGLRAPGVMAKMTTNIDHISKGRFAINLVSAWWLPEYEMLGSPVLAHNERYARSAEYIDVMKGLWTEDDFSYSGDFFDIKNASISPKALQQPHVPIYIGGESEQGRSLGARVADIFLINGRPPEQIKEIVTNMKQRAEQLGRTLRFGMSGFVICRDTEEAAETEFQRLLSLRHMDIKGADKEVEMLKVLPDDVEKIGTNGGTAAGLIGTPEQIAERMHEFESLGIETFLLQFHPTLEEIQRFASDVIPLL